MDTPKIYAACLSSFNNCIVYGRWINADQSLKQIRNEIQDMLTNSPIEGAKEYALHDYEGFGRIKLSHDDGLETVINYATFIAEHGDLGTNLIADLGFKYAKALLENHFHGVFESEVDFAYTLFNECYCNALPENLSFYFDYAAYTRDLFTNDFISVDVEGKLHIFSRLQAS